MEDSWRRIETVTKMRGIPSASDIQSNFFRFFVNKTGNREDAKDLVQETLIEAMVNLSTLQKPESFRGWLYTITRGILAKYFRDRDNVGDLRGCCENSMAAREANPPKAAGGEIPR